MIKKIKQKVCEIILKVLNIKQCFCSNDCECRNPKEKTNA
jgi:hypothetical protein